MLAELDLRAAQLARDFPILAQPTSRGKRLAYLDSAASSQKPQAVLNALLHYYTHDNANIHRGVYELAERATDAFERAREKVAHFVNAAEPAEIIWTRNTTEGINLVSYTWGLRNLAPGDAILTSQLEHHSNLVPWQLLAAKTGAELRFIEVDANGVHRSSSRSRTFRTLSARSRRSRSSCLRHTRPGPSC
jgi:cysteine desulfurase/selenocysteine lyase